MKKVYLTIMLAVAAVFPVSANPYMLLYPAVMLGAQVATIFGPPLIAVTGYGVCNTPAVHVFGTENITVGLDWGSFSARSKNIYGLQMSLVGGGFSEDLYGIQTSIIASGWVDGYDTSLCRMNGIQIAPFAVKTSMANGFQLCPIYSKASIVNGFQLGGIYSTAGNVRGIQCGLVNTAGRADGIQIGLYNLAKRGCCLQLGLINCVYRRNMPVFPLINMGFR